MSKMGELAQELAELKRCAETLISISETLTEMFSRADEPEEKSEVKAPVKEAKKEAKPVAKKELKLTDVRAVLAEKSRAGFTKEVKELLIKHGADKLSAIDPAEYEALLVDVEVLGNG